MLNQQQQTEGVGKRSKRDALPRVWLKNERVKDKEAERCARKVQRWVSTEARRKEMLALYLKNDLKPSRKKKTLMKIPVADGAGFYDSLPMFCF